MLDRLKQICETILSSQVHISNIDSFLMLGEIHNAQQLRSICFEYILDHLYEIIENGMFLSFSDSIIENLQKILNERILNDFNDFILPPKYFIQAMEDEFLFKLNKNQIQSSNDHFIDSNESIKCKIRNLRKKLYQVYRIEEKKLRGEKLHADQISKMYQRPFLLQQLSQLTGESVDVLLRSTKLSFKDSILLSPEMNQNSPEIEPIDNFSLSENKNENQSNSDNNLHEKSENKLISNDDKSKMDEKHFELNKNENHDVIVNNPQILNIENEKNNNEDENEQIQSFPKPISVSNDNEENLYVKSPSLPAQNFSKKRKRNNSQKKKGKTTFSLTSPNQFSSNQQNKQNQPKKNENSISNIKQATSPPKTWGKIPTTNKNQNFSISQIQNEQKQQKQSSNPISIPNSRKSPQKPSLSPNKKSPNWSNSNSSPGGGWMTNISPKSPPVSFLDIQMEQKPKSQKQQQQKRMKNKQSPSKSPISPSPTKQTTLPSKKTSKKSTPISFSDLLAEEKNQNKKAEAPKLRDIMGQELTARALSNPNDVNLEQQLIQLAIQASLEEQ